MPDGWQPRDHERNKAGEMGLNCDREAERFRDHHTARGSVFADWDAAFRTWLGNALRFQGSSRAPAFSPSSSGNGGVRAILTREQRERLAREQTESDHQHEGESA